LGGGTSDTGVVIIHTPAIVTDVEVDLVPGTAGWACHRTTDDGTASSSRVDAFEGGTADSGARADVGCSMEFYAISLCDGDKSGEGASVGALIDERIAVVYAGGRHRFAC
jgi:hypothetical protein